MGTPPPGAKRKCVLESGCGGRYHTHGLAGQAGAKEAKTLDWAIQGMLTLAGVSVLAAGWVLAGRGRIGKGYALFWTAAGLALVAAAVLYARWELVLAAAVVLVGAGALALTLEGAAWEAREKVLRNEIAALRKELEGLREELKEARRPQPEQKPRPPSLRT